VKARCCRCWPGHELLNREATHQLVQKLTPEQESPSTCSHLHSLSVASIDMMHDDKAAHVSRSYSALSETDLNCCSWIDVVLTRAAAKDTVPTPIWH
jgi:hypothetical protein